MDVDSPYETAVPWSRPTLLAALDRSTTAPSRRFLRSPLPMNQPAGELPRPVPLPTWWASASRADLPSEYYLG